MNIARYSVVFDTLVLTVDLTSSWPWYVYIDVCAALGSCSTRLVLIRPFARLLLEVDAMHAYVQSHDPTPDVATLLLGLQSSLWVLLCHFEDCCMYVARS